MPAVKSEQIPTWTSQNKGRQIVIITTYVLVLFIFTYKTLLNFPQTFSQETLKYYVDRYGLQSSTYQVSFFVVYLCLLGLCALLLSSSTNFSIHPHPLENDRRNLVTLRVGLTLLALFIFLYADYSEEFRFGFTLTLVVVLIIKKFKLNEKIKFRPVKNLIIFSCLIFFFVYIIFPFFTPPIFDSNSLYIISSEHYAAVLLPGYDLSCCGKINNSFYGLGTAFLVAIALKLLSFLPVNHEYLLFFVVRIFQVIAIFLIFLVARLANKKNFVIVGSITMLLTVQINTAGSGNYYANHSGLRFTWFLVGLIAVTQLSKRKSCQLFLYSLISSALITMNVDTGLMISAGIITLFVLQDSVQKRQRFRLLLSLFSILVSIILLTTFLTLLVQLFFDGYTTPLAIALGQQGSNGQIGRLNVSAIFFIFFGTIYFLQGFILNHQHRSHTVKKFQAAMAAVLLFSLVYYFSRMSPANLWFQVIPFMLMISPSINGRLFQMIRSHSNTISILAIVTFSFIGGLAFLNAFKLYQTTYTSYLALYRSDCELKISIFQSLCNTFEDPVVITDYVREAKNLAEGNNSVVISILPSTIKTADFNQTLPWDIFRPTNTTEIEEWRAWFKTNKPQFLLFDNPSSNLSLSRPGETQFNRTLLGYLSNYRLEGASYYWEKYRRVEPSG